MSVKNLKKPSETDWARIDSMTDEEIDTSDSPPLDDDFFARAEWRMPEKMRAVTLSISSRSQLVYAIWIDRQKHECQRVCSMPACDTLVDTRVSAFLVITNFALLLRFRSSEMV
ncbi:hypothetical protein BH10ACI1_BH10ACI1_00240 [soil metagenome]